MLVLTVISGARLLQPKGLVPHPALSAAASSAAPAASRKAVRCVFVCSRWAVFVFAPLFLFSRCCSAVLFFACCFHSVILEHFYFGGNMIYKYTLYDLDILGFLE